MGKKRVSPPLNKELVSVVRRERRESDRGFTLIVAAWIDDVLGDVIRSRFVDDHRAADALLDGDNLSLPSPHESSSSIAWGDQQGRAARPGHDPRYPQRVCHNRGDIAFETPSIRDRCVSFSLLDRIRAMKTIPNPRPRLLFMHVSMYLILFLTRLIRPENRPLLMRTTYSTPTSRS